MNDQENLNETQTDDVATEEAVEDVTETADATLDATENDADAPLAQALQQAEDFRAALQRERADFMNYKKRMERENDVLRTRVSGDVLAKFLPVIDDFERAWEAIPDAEKANEWMKGFNLIHRKFQSLIESEGIVAINPLGEPFDPNYHEAIGADEPSEDIASGHVTAVLQKGYQHGERVLRPALVRVAN